MAPPTRACSMLNRLNTDRGLVSGWRYECSYECMEIAVHEAVESGTARLKRDGTSAETRFGLSAKRTSPFKSWGEGGGGQFSRLLAAEVCASAVVMVIMLDTPCSEVQCKTTGYPLHSHVSPSLPLPCVTVCHQVSTELFQQIPPVWRWATIRH